MRLDSYKVAFDEFFASPAIRSSIAEAVAMITPARRVLFIGNGGSNAICSHMMEDYMKMARKQTLSFTDAALITCFANDYGYEHAQTEWIKFNYQTGDVLVAISSSGESKNILNAVDAHKTLGGGVITLSGFAADNTLSRKGNINFITPVKNYGIVETFHQVILHAILDELV
jgi:D-sedoheptulose 7-phosphate isomerase